MNDLWHSCLTRLEAELSQQEVHTWLRPLQVRSDSDTLRLLAPNAYTLEMVRGQYLERIAAVLKALSGHDVPVRLEVGTLQRAISEATAPSPAPVGNG
ncbi:MAG: DnaA N-terminal domain-containing protein, partial [Rhodanobacteraceae bacterium]